MRYSEIVTLTEGVSFHPAVLEVKSGETYINYPPGTFIRERVTCPYCKGTGKDAYAAEHGHDEVCDSCFGSLTTSKETITCPELDVSGSTGHMLSQLLGFDDEGDSSGWIPPEQIATAKRNLIRLMNTSVDQYTQEPEDRQDTRVNREGPVPAIERGPRMISGGYDEGMIRAYINRLMPILDWAQKNGTGVSWA